jgi:hypothetical protein
MHSNAHHLLVIPCSYPVARDITRRPALGISRIATPVRPINRTFSFRPSTYSQCMGVSGNDNVLSRKASQVKIISPQELPHAHSHDSDIPRRQLTGPGRTKLRKIASKPSLTSLSSAVPSMQPPTLGSTASPPIFFTSLFPYSKQRAVPLPLIGEDVQLFPDDATTRIEAPHTQGYDPILIER